MTTRLDRLFLLLDTGSTPVIRKSAAEQLGEVQKLHSHELHNLLAKVHGYLASSSWDTRIAAGQAVRAIASNVPHWSPPGTPKQERTEVSQSIASGQLAFSHFDIQRVLIHGASLLGSEGAEYDLENTPGLDQKEQIARQKHLLNKKLGLDMAGGLGFSTEDLFRDEDLVVKDTTRRGSEHSRSQAVADLVKQQLISSGGEMSARERNRAKRKAKQIAKQVSRETEQKTNGEGSDSEPSNKKRKTASVIVEQPQEATVLVDNLPDNTLNMEEVEEWPFESFCELLMNDLFNASWEKRHGAATGLREVIKLHGHGAGKTVDTPADQMEQANHQWLEDLALRLLCVLALDRFGDFVSDEVVAPVRETCAQTLGVVLHCMQPLGVQGVQGVLLQLLAQTQWEVRHGGLLGLKYLLAIRKDMHGSLVPVVLPAIFHGLQDRDDDVRAVAAAALNPVAGMLIQMLPQEIPGIINCLWNTLLDLDDLTASTNSIMILLATFLAHPTGMLTLGMLMQPLTDLVPRLWPFLRHNIASVRRAALDTLHALLQQDNPPVPVMTWMTEILQDAMRHLYQRSLLEEKDNILVIVQKVWCMLLEKLPVEYVVGASSPWLGAWMCLMMQPSNVAFDQNLLIEAKHRLKEHSPTKVRHLLDAQQQQNKEQHADYIGGFQSLNESPHHRDRFVVRARIMAAKLLGLLSSTMSQPLPNYPEGFETPLESLAKLCLFHLESKSASQRFAVSLVVQQWALAQQPCVCPVSVKATLLKCLTESIYFDEIAISFTRMQAECKELLACLRQQGVNMDVICPPGAVLTMEQAHRLATTVFDQVKGQLPAQVAHMLEERRRNLNATVTHTSQEQYILNMRVQSSLAGALVLLQHLPDKLNPIIRPLMEALKKESNSDLQTSAARTLSQLLRQCVSRSPCPNPKVTKNICAMLCSDPDHTPPLSQESLKPGTSSEASTSNQVCDTKYSGILTLNAQQKLPERSGKKMSFSKRGSQGSLGADLSMEVLKEEEENKRQLVIQRHGAELALATIARDCGADLPSTMPQLWDAMLAPLTKTVNTQEFDANALIDKDPEAQELVHSLQIMETVGPAIHTDLHGQLVECLPPLCCCLQHPYTTVRHMVTRALAMLSKLVTMETMNYLMENAFSLLGMSENVTARQGAIEAVANVIERMGMAVVPYIVLLVVPVLGCMSDQDEAVRLMATQCFATLIKLMPLEAGIPDPPAMKTSLVQQKEQERKFLEQLLDGRKVEDYKVPVPIQAQLRKYQQDGVNWLAFLNKYKLHGILCDDMGLGKTLQSLCILAGDHYLRQQRYQETNSVDSAPLPSIVVCPPTLTGHWVYEVEKFVSKEHLSPLHYTGPPMERAKLRSKVKKHNLVVASYDIVRNDIDFFGSIKWNYCILDEGHIIKNGKTKLSKAVKQLSCNHRLILSGTPLQNNVLELWSLFDFLMPGFLGTEKQFQARYGKPILLSRDAKSSSREQEAGALAMEALHRQVLPFLLRRLKEDVLQDLPPKIIQDYYCDLSPLQVQLYEDFAKSRAKKSIENCIETTDEGSTKTDKADIPGTTHIFQALQYLRKVCNHPALVLNKQHPEYDSIMSQLKQQGSQLRDIQHAPKLTNLKQLLQDCGIGVASIDSQDAPVVNQHRVLLFCQLKSMLDIVEQDLFKSQMPDVTYFRLDGSVPAGNRHSIVNRFNNDPSIDVLLLTTHVGGLGLNLTGADTVIFVEHDWNPMKDLQAMDRAHRIGQKKVVNVYRLISRGTLEEKIMGLQKFKLNIANTVITADNSSLSSMGTDQLLDLFSLDEKRKAQSSSAGNSQSSSTKKPESVRNILDNLGELWDEKQYETEYNLDNFMQSLSQ